MANNTQLRILARALIQRAATGDTSALRELADRVDGKVPQAIVGDSSEDPINVRAIAWLDADMPRSPAIENQGSKDVELIAEEVRPPVEPVSTFAIKPFRRRDRNRYMREYMWRRRAAAKAARNGDGRTRAQDETD